MSFFRSIGGKMICALAILLVIATIPIAIISNSAALTYSRMDQLIGDNLPLLSTSADAAKIAQRVATNVEAVLRAELPLATRRTAIDTDLATLNQRLSDLRGMPAAGEDARVQKALATLGNGIGTFGNFVRAALATHDEVLEYNFALDGKATNALNQAYTTRTTYQRLFKAVEDSVRFSAPFSADRDITHSDITRWVAAQPKGDEKLRVYMEKLAGTDERAYRSVNQILDVPAEDRESLLQKHSGTVFFKLLNTIDSIISYMTPTMAALQEREEADVARMERATADLVEQIGALEGAAQVSFAEQRDKVETDQNVADFHGLVVTGLAVLAAIGLSIAVSLHLSAPIGRLVRDMRRLADGDTHLELRETARRDEIGDIGRALAIFRGTSLDREALQRAAEMEKERQHMLEEKALREAQRLEEAKRLEEAIEELGRGLHHLAEGKLFYRIVDELSPNVEKLRLDFNSAMQRVQRAISEVGGCAGDIRSGSSDISGVADDLAHRVEQQASSLQQTASALDQITTAVGRTAEGASHAHAVVAAAKRGAEGAGTVVGQAIETINRIEASSQKIGQIIGVIDEIAFQTNLLALNAGVEAARAGEAGRGFAVVALEVRALAQRSADAAREIKTLISNSKAEVDQGVERVTETGRSLRAIVGQVAEINEAVSNIAESANLHSQQLREINGAVNNMDQVTQRNTLIVQRATETSRALGLQTERLQGLMSSFELGASQLTDALKGSRSASETLPAPVRGRTEAARPTRSATGPVARVAGALARVAAPKKEEESWADF